MQMNIEPSSSNKNPPGFHVEVKRVTWSKDSHGLFDYESKNVNFSKSKVDSTTNVYKEDVGNEIRVLPVKKSQSQDTSDPNFLFSIDTESEKDDKFVLKAPRIEQYETNKQNLFLIVRSLKNEEGTQRGYTLELGDIIRLGRIEYRVIEYQDKDLNRFSLFDSIDTIQNVPFSLAVKPVTIDHDVQNVCRICLMDEHGADEVLVDPCNCKGTGQYVHIACLQNWINSKVKQKATVDSSCYYWKNLICEICKTPLPDLMDAGGKKIQLVPAYRPDLPYMLVERIFYDKSKGGENSRMMVLLSISNEGHLLKLGRGHECDIRENDISVSRLHAFIRYQDSKFVIVDNNSKFGTLILLRRDFEIEKRKIAIQIGRTVITFSLKQTASANNVTNHNEKMPIEDLRDTQEDDGKDLQNYNMNNEDFMNEM